MATNVGAEISPNKQRGKPFRPGQSGNPLGKPKGARNRSTLAAELLLDGEAEALTRKAIELALAGDTTALRLCIERLVPPRKDRPICVELPEMHSHADIVDARRAVLRAVASGSITPSEACQLAALIEAQGKLLTPEPAPIEVVDIRINFVPAKR